MPPAKRESLFRIAQLPLHRLEGGALFRETPARAGDVGSGCPDGSAYSNVSRARQPAANASSCVCVPEAVSSSAR